MYSIGRPSALLTFILLCGLTIILVISVWITRGNTNYVSLAPLFLWGSCLLSFSMIAITIFCAFKNNHAHVVDEFRVRLDEVASDQEDLMGDYENERQIGLPKWAKIPFRSIAILICCIGSLLIPSYDTYRNIVNIVCLNGESETLRLSIFKCLCNIVFVLFCIYQLVFIMLFYNKAAKSSFLKCAMSFCVSANFFLCVHVIMNVIWMSDTLDLKGTLNSMPINISNRDIHGKHVYLYLKCSNNSLEIDKVALYLYKYSYQFALEFAVFSLCSIGVIWNVVSPIGGKDTQTCSDNVSVTHNESEAQLNQSAATISTTNQCWRWVKKSARATFVCGCNHAFLLAAIWVAGVFSFNLYTDIKHDSFGDSALILRDTTVNTTYTNIEKSNTVLQAVHTYMFSILAFVGFIVVKKMRMDEKPLRPIDISLLVGAAGHLLLILFETIDVISKLTESKSEIYTTTKVSFVMKTIFHYIGVFSQTVLVIHASKLNVTSIWKTKGKQLFAKAIIVFIGVYNMEKWFEDSFLPPSYLRYVDDIPEEDLYGFRVWWFIVEVLYPLATTYRLLTVVMSYEINVRIKRKIAQFPE